MNYSGLIFCDSINGLGLRTTLFVSGCDWKCLSCHNPQTWNDKNGKEYTHEIHNEIINSLKDCFIDGITLTGGDPLYKSNLSDVFNIVTDVKRIYGIDKTIWLYTGYVWEDIFKSNSPDNIKRQLILKLCDVVVDGRFEIDKKDVTLAFRGSSNQRLIDVKKSLKAEKVIELELE